MGEEVKLYEYKDIVLTDEILTYKGGKIPVKEISSFEVADCGVGRARWILPLLVGATGYAVLWFCSGDNSFIALNNITGVFLLGIVVFSAVVVMRSLDFEPEGMVKLVVVTIDRRITVLKTKELQAINRLEEALKKILENSKD